MEKEQVIIMVTRGEKELLDTEITITPCNIINVTVRFDRWMFATLSRENFWTHLDEYIISRL